MMKILLLVCVLIALISAESQLNIIKKQSARESKLSQKASSSKHLKIAFQGSCKEFFKQSISISKYQENGCLPIVNGEDAADLNADVQCANVKKNRSLISFNRVYEKTKKSYKGAFVVSFRPTRPVMSLYRSYGRRPSCNVEKSICNGDNNAVVNRCEENPVNFDQKKFYVLNDDCIYISSSKKINVTGCFANNVKGACCSYISPSNGICPLVAPTGLLQEVKSEKTSKKEKSKKSSEEDEDEEQVEEEEDDSFKKKKKGFKKLGKKKSKKAIPFSFGE